MILPLPDWATLVVATLTIILGVGRLVRVITYDTFPPAARVRALWDKLTSRDDGEEGPWTILFHCFWCFTPWMMLVAMGWFALGLAVTWVAWTWWIFWGWLALSYVTSMVIVRDEPGE